MALLQRAEDVAGEIVGRLEAILTANGAETDVGATVYQGKLTVERDRIPCTVVIEGDDTIERGKVGGLNQVMQRYALLAYGPCDPDNPNVAAHAQIRDFKRAIFRTGGRADVTFGGKVKSVEYLGRDIGPRADGEAFVLSIIEIGVTYVEDLGSP